MLPKDDLKNKPLLNTNYNIFHNFSSLKSLKEIEKSYINHILSKTSWHKGKSATILGISRPTLDKKIEEFGIKKDV